MGSRLSCTAAKALLAAVATGGLVAQRATLAETLARFPDDQLPAILRSLDGPRPEATLRAAQALGERAHRILFGHMRTTRRANDFADAFGDFGPHSTWALPGLLELGNQRFLPRTAADLLERLGPTAVAAIGLLREHGHTDLADRIAAADASVEPRALPTVRVPDALRAELLAVLADPDRIDRWWPALQALLQLDLDASLDAAVILLQAALRDDPAASRHAHDLLLAMRCHHAAFSLLDPEAAVDVFDVAPDELLRTVLAAWPCLPNSDGAPAAHHTSTLPERVVVSNEPRQRTACALAAALHAFAWPAEAQATTTLRRLRDETEDERSTQLLDITLRRVEQHVAELFARPLDARSRDDFWKLSDDQLRELPLERLLEALAPDTSGSRLNALAHVNLAKRFVVAAPHLVRDNELSPEHRRAVLTLIGHAPEAPEELFDWLVEHADCSKPERSYAAAPLTIRVAPAVLRALRDPARIARALQVLDAQIAYLHWAEFCDEHAETLASLDGAVPEDHREAYYRLFRYGPRARVEVERLYREAGSDAHRELLLKTVPPDPRFGSSGTFVLELFERGDERAERYARRAARQARDRHDELFSVLRERADGEAVEDLARGFLIHSIGGLRLEAARPWLVQHMRDGEPWSRLYAALALLDLGGADDDAAATITALVDTDDQRLRLGAWLAVSESVAASARLLEAAVQDLDPPTEWRETTRLFRVIEAAHDRRAEDVLKLLHKYEKGGDSNMSQQARQVLQRLVPERRPGR